MAILLAVIFVPAVVVGLTIGVLRRGDGMAVLRTTAWAALLIATLSLGVLIQLDGRTRATTARGFAEQYEAQVFWVGSGPFLILIIWLITFISAALIGAWAFRRRPREYWRENNVRE